MANDLIPRRMVPSSLGTCLWSETLRSKVLASESESRIGGQTNPVTKIHTRCRMLKKRISKAKAVEDFHCSNMQSISMSVERPGGALVDDTGMNTKLRHPQRHHETIVRVREDNHDGSNGWTGRF